MSVLSTVEISVNFHKIVWYVVAIYEPDLIPLKYFCTAGILSHFIGELFFQVLPGKIPIQSRARSVSPTLKLTTAP